MAVDVRIWFLRYALLQDGHYAFSMVAVGCRCGEVTYRWLEFLTFLWQFSFSAGFVFVFVFVFVSAGIVIHIVIIISVNVLRERLKL